MLQGVRDPLERELAGKGQRVEKYISYGPKWLPYFSRRLREWPRDILVMVRSFVGG
jgi:proline dehydrogenase